MVSKLSTRVLAVFLAVALLASAQDTDYVFRSKTEIVLVNVTVRDKNGNFVRDLKPEDFTVSEDNKPQKILSFDLENTDAAVTQDVAQVKVLGQSVSQPAAPAAGTKSAAFKDRRLVILFFDLSSMEPDEIERSAKAAQNYVDKQMSPADLVAIVSLANSITIDQDFTS